ncbi:MAG: cell division inhibitor SulA [Alphaproteobacteria bacterium]|jgi:cell division inhibitor SulA
MNPILHDLQNKQWVWTAANAKHQVSTTKLATGYESLDNVLSSGFPAAGMIHLESPLGCGEMRLMLSILQRQHTESDDHKLYMFIDPPFTLNAEFLLEQNISLSQLVVVRTSKIEDALWSAEQCAKSGACCVVFMWQHKLKHIQVRKLEHAAQQGNCYCVWLHNCSNTAHLSGQNTDKGTVQSNLPLSLSLSISRQADNLSIKINKQKIGWAQKAVKIPLPFNSRTHSSLKRHSVNGISKVVPIQVNR